MGFLLSKLASALSEFGNSNARILLLGLDAAGKTTILYKLKLNENVTTIPTIGFNVEEVTPVKNVTFTMWDVGGQEKIRPLWRHYYQVSDFLYVRHFVTSRVSRPMISSYFEISGRGTLIKKQNHIVRHKLGCLFIYLYVFISITFISMKRLRNDKNKAYFNHQIQAHFLARTGRKDSNAIYTHS